MTDEQRELVIRRLAQITGMSEGEIQGWSDKHLIYNLEGFGEFLEDLYPFKAIRCR